MHHQELATRKVRFFDLDFDFLAGRQRRAPTWMRRGGPEWVHRMLTQPARLGPRYARDALTFARLCGSQLRRREA